MSNIGCQVPKMEIYGLLTFFASTVQKRARRVSNVVKNRTRVAILATEGQKTVFEQCNMRQKWNKKEGVL